MDEKIAQIALRLTAGVGDILTRNLVTYCGSASAVFAMPLGKLKKIKGIPAPVVEAIATKGAFDRAKKIVLQAEKTQTNILFFTDEAYPQRLRKVYDAPAVLYMQGAGTPDLPRTLAIVGTRKATEYGRRFTEEIIEQLAGYQVGIVSGLAFGIDIAAHKAAMQVGLPTFGVMANGLDTVYPASHKKTAQAMQDHGAILSEHPFGVLPDPRFFLNRNRIIAGLSDAVLVVESGIKGGAMNTAEYANNYNREVFAVPGSLKSSVSEGCHHLIAKNKANIFTNLDTLVEALGWDGVSARFQTPPDLSQGESEVVAVLRDSGSIHIDALMYKIQRHPAELSALLLNLEFKGFVRSLPGKIYSLG